MRWIIDTDVFIEGERGSERFAAWRYRPGEDEFATADAVRCEFLLGVYAVAKPESRARGEQFYREQLSRVASLGHEPADFDTAARLAGEARRGNKGRPSLVDGLLAALALRTGATVATRNVADFEAMGCPAQAPF